MAVHLTETAIRKGVKKCRTCGKTKPISEFIKNLKNKWMPNDCLECERLRHKKLHKMQYSTVARSNQKSSGFDRDDRPGKCEACSSSIQICLDHCHITGLARGWLCQKCNTILGFVDDNPDCLRTLAEYLERFYSSEEIKNRLHQEDLIYLPI